MSQNKIVLTWHEVALASHVGWMRNISSMRDKRTKGAGLTTAGWTEHCEGACGELALAKKLGLYWNGSIDTFSANDLPGLQVRTRSRPEYELIIRPQDSDDAIWVLLTGQSPEFWVRGWIRGREAKQKEWLRSYGNRPEAYFVPTDRLHPVEELGRQG